MLSIKQLTRRKIFFILSVHCVISVILKPVTILKKKNLVLHKFHMLSLNWSYIMSESINYLCEVKYIMLKSIWFSTIDEFLIVVKNYFVRVAIFELQYPKMYKVWMKQIKRAIDLAFVVKTYPRFVLYLVNHWINSNRLRVDMICFLIVCACLIWSMKGVIWSMKYEWFEVCRALTIYESTVLRIRYELFICKKQ